MFKLYTHEDVDDAQPYECCKFETESYDRLQKEQGRWIPRHYGLVIWDFQLGVILQRVPGDPLDEAQIDVERLPRDLPSIVDKLNKGKVWGDLNCTNLIDDGEQIWLIDFDTAFEIENRHVVAGTDAQLAQISKELKDNPSKKQDIQNEWYIYVKPPHVKR